MHPAVDIEDGIKKGYIDASENPTRREDYRKVWSFGQLKGRPSLPVDPTYDPQPAEVFDKMVSRLDGRKFFDPFNDILELIAVPPVQLEPSRKVVDSWNKPGFVTPIVAEVCDRLDSGNTPLLVPKLVAIPGPTPG